MISARLTDENLGYLNRVHNIFGINKNNFINSSIKNYYKEFIEKYKQSNVIYSLEEFYKKEEETN